VEDDQSQSGRTPRKARRPKIERKSVTTINAPTTATVMDAARERRLLIPLVLAALCGLRRGEITALHWKSIDLDAGQLAVISSTEQLDTGDKSKRIREKEAKSGKARNGCLALARGRGVAPLAPGAGRGTVKARHPDE
jgi:integrase